MFDVAIWGTVGTWVGGLASATAAAVAVWLAWRARRDAERHNTAEARRVFGWGSADGQGGHISFDAYVQNATSTPLTNVGVKLLTDPNQPFGEVRKAIPALAPGQTQRIRTRAPWSGVINNPPCYVVVTFQDADGVVCMRHPDGSLTEGTTAIRYPKYVDLP